MKKLNIYIALIIIIILTLVTFSHVLSSQFINLDDNKYITENPLVIGLLGMITSLALNPIISLIFPNKEARA